MARLMICSDFCSDEGDGAGEGLSSWAFAAENKRYKSSINAAIERRQVCCGQRPNLKFWYRTASGSERVSRRTAIDPLATARGSVGASQTRTPPGCFVISTIYDSRLT